MGIKTTLYLDFENNDLTLASRQIRLTNTKLEYVQMTAKAVCEVWLGEWYRNRGLGVPYLQDVLGAERDFDRVRTVITGAANSVTYVIDVVEYDFDFDNAKSTYSATLSLLIEGEDSGTQLTTINVNAEV